MQTTSDLWQSIASEPYTTSIRLVVAGKEVNEGQLLSLKTSLHLFPDGAPTAGNAVCGQLSTDFVDLGLQIPRMGEIVLQAQITNGARTSEWKDLGHYFIDTRKKDETDGVTVLSLTCFDAMLKAEADCPLFDLDYPATDLALVQKIAESMGVSVDSRTLEILTKGYTIGSTAGYSKREVLSGIAAMYGGTWIISPVGQLRLVRMFDVPASEGVLITESGADIEIGGVRICV